MEWLTKGIVREFGKLISEAQNHTISGMRNGRIETEDSITNRFFNEVERVFEYRRRGDILFRARFLRDRGPHAPEHEFGGDVWGVLNVKFRNFEQSKGFLIQAKKANRIKAYVGPMGFSSVNFSDNDEFRRLKNQASKMLQITPDSFVIIYSTDCFIVVPAASVVALKNGEIYGKLVPSFFKEFLMCFVGDHRLKAWNDQSLEELRRENKARMAILFQVIGQD